MTSEGRRGSPAGSCRGSPTAGHRASGVVSAAAAEGARTPAPRGRGRERGRERGRAGLLLTWSPPAAASKPRKAAAQTEQTTLLQQPLEAPGDTLLPGFWRPPARLGPHPGPLLPLPPSQGLLLALAASPPPEGPCHAGSPPHLTISNRLTPAKPLLQCEVTCPRAAGHGPLGGPGILPTTPLAPPGPAPTRHSVNVRGGNE